MSRLDGASTQIRSDLEAALGALADHGECLPRVRLRVQQAIRRAALDDLLGPVLDELDRMAGDVADAKVQVNAAVRRLSA